MTVDSGLLSKRLNGGAQCTEPNSLGEHIQSTVNTRRNRMKFICSASLATFASSLVINLWGIYYFRVRSTWGIYGAIVGVKIAQRRHSESICLLRLCERTDSSCISIFSQTKVKNTISVRKSGEVLRVEGRILIKRSKSAQCSRSADWFTRFFLHNLDKYHVVINQLVISDFLFGTLNVMNKGSRNLR